MTKVGESEVDEDVIVAFESLTIRAVRRENGSMPAKEWFDGLDLKLQARVLAAARVLEASWRVSRPNGQKWSKIKGHELWEFRATSKKAQPSLRILGEQEGLTMWAAIGIQKSGQKLKASEIEMAKRMLSERAK